MYILLIFVSLLPYIWIGGAVFETGRLPPVDLLVVVALNCVLLHVIFIWYSKRKSFDFFLVTLYFYWLFFGLSPLANTISGRWLWGDITFEKQGYILYAIVLLWLFLGVFSISYMLTFRGTQKGRVSHLRTTREFAFSIAGLLTVGLSLLAVAILGVDGLVARGGADIGGSTVPFSGLIAQNVLRPALIFMPVFIWLGYSASDRGVGLYRPALVVALIVVGLAMNLPTSLGRYSILMLGTTLLGAIYIIYGKFARRLFLAPMLLLVSMVGSFFIAGFRYAESVGEVIEQFATKNVGVSSNQMFSGDLDAFEVFVYGLEYSDLNGVSLGRQGLGVALFWVPRGWWDQKPLPTGTLLGETHINIMTRADNTNLSAPLPLEGYMNFGVVGVVLFAAGFGFVLGLIERNHMRCVARGVLISYSGAIRLPLLGLWLYILRGSLLPTFAYSFAISISAVGCLYAVTEYRRLTRDVGGRRSGLVNGGAV